MPLQFIDVVMDIIDYVGYVVYNIHDVVFVAIGGHSLFLPVHVDCVWVSE